MLYAECTQIYCKLNNFFITNSTKGQFPGNGITIQQNFGSNLTHLIGFETLLIIYFLILSGNIHSVILTFEYQTF